MFNEARFVTVWAELQYALGRLSLGSSCLAEQQVSCGGEGRKVKKKKIRGCIALSGLKNSLQFPY